MRVGKLISWALATPLAIQAVKLPLSTSGRWFVDADGKKFTYIGVNWPGHMETMLPEGLQHQSIPSIVSKVKRLGMNSIRLTYATEMIDDIINHHGDVTVKASVVKMLGEKNGTVLFENIVKKNSFITEQTTRLQVFDRVAEECRKEGILVHLDNHISKAKWCCDTGDGNSWFGDREFHTENWKDGWKFMAKYTRKWSNLASFGLRNELRSPDGQDLFQMRDTPLKVSYNWTTWNMHMRNITLDVHNINPNAVIFLSGLGFDTDLSPITTARDLGNGARFRKADWPKDKVALELHRYDSKVANVTCSGLKQALLKSGWNGIDGSDKGVVNHLPVVMTEFGFDHGNGAYNSVYAKCLKDFFVERQAGWMYWVLAGSYYRRQGKEDHDEKWGILNHDWSGWRNSQVVEEYFMPMTAKMGGQMGGAVMAVQGW